MPTLNPFCYHLLKPYMPPTTTSTKIIPHNSIKYYKQLISPSKQRLFWNLNILLSALIIWYILQKILTKSFLHQLMPDNHPTRRYIICSSNSTEDYTHFIFMYPLRLCVWRTITHAYLSHINLSDASILTLLHNIHYFDISALI